MATLGWDSVSNETSQKKERQAKIYIFCVHNHTDKGTINPLDTSQWDFYILPTAVLNEKVRSQKTIGLSALIKIGAEKCAYSDLRTAVSKYA